MASDYRLISPATNLVVHLVNSTGTPVAGGIAEALIATGVGIFVALPAVVAYNLGAKRAADIEGETLSLGKLIAAWLRSAPEEGESVTAADAETETASDSVTKRSDAKSSDARLGDLAFEGSR